MLFDCESKKAGAVAMPRTELFFQGTSLAVCSAWCEANGVNDLGIRAQGQECLEASRDSLSQPFAVEDVSAGAAEKVLVGVTIRVFPRTSIIRCSPVERRMPTDAVSEDWTLHSAPRYMTRAVPFDSHARTSTVSPMSICTLLSACGAGSFRRERRECHPSVAAPQTSPAIKS